MKRVLLSNVRPRLIEGDVPGSLFDPFRERLLAARESSALPVIFMRGFR
jgi:hypothetical protein